MKKKHEFAYPSIGIRKLLRIMKIAILLILTFGVGAYANTYGQSKKFSFNMKNVSIEDVLNRLEKESDFHFYMKQNDPALDKVVDVDYKDASVLSVLDDLLQDTGLNYRVIDKYIAIIPGNNNSNNTGIQQTIKITGKVVDSNGDPLPGVNVYEKSNPQHGVITGIDGTYSIEVDSPEDLLIFSFIGFDDQEITVGGTRQINVTLMEEMTDLDEVVVTALGIKREVKKLGYAMTEVEGDDIAAVNTVTAVDALKGKSAGVSIGQSDGGLFGSQKIQIRGVSVLNSGNNNPIFVIDGVIMDNPISNAHADWDGSSNDFGNVLKNLNPDDFESVSVLKGAAATALYGSRGINGAVVIKTKDGSGQKGLGVKVVQSIGIDHVYNQPDFQYEYGPGTIAGYVNYGEKDADGKFYMWDINQVYRDGDGNFTKIGHPGDWAGWGPKFDGRDLIDFDGSATTFSPAKNHARDAYQTGFNTNTSVALSGGNEKGTFYLSDSYQKRKGIFPQNEFTRNALQFSGSYKLADWLKADASISFTTSTPKNPRNDLGTSYINGPFTNWYDTKKWNKSDIYVAKHGGVPSNAYGDQNTNIPGNSLWFGYNKDQSYRNEQVTRPIVRLTADLSNWLSVTAEGNMNHYTISAEEKYLGQGYANDGGKYVIRNEVNVSRTGKLTLNINKDITQDITSSLILGGEIWDNERKYTKAWTDGGLIAPGKFFINNSKKLALTEGVVDGTKQINSLYFLANFGWRNQVYLDITGRNDWSSALVYKDGSGNNSYFYPSVSSSWLFSETFELPSWVTFGKLRASWAQVGNDTEAYFLNKGYKLENIPLDGGSNSYIGVKPSEMIDPNIKPERKNSIELGLDVRFLNGRLGFDFAWYDETINDQIGMLPLPEESGATGRFTNVGSLKNEGIELTVNATPVKVSDFSWKTTFNYWNNTTTLQNLHEDFGAYKVLDGLASYGNYRIASVGFDGGEYGVLMSDTKPLEWNNESDPNDPRNGMKVLTWSDGKRGAFNTRSYKVEEVGKIQPDFEGSWDNSFTYKGLSLSVLLDARFGGNIGSFTNKYGTANGLLATSLKYRDASHGGITWTSEYADTKGRTYSDGMIPDGVFKEGQEVTAPNGSKVDVGGMTYQEAYDKGYVEPTHASFNTYFNNSWSRGTINDDWFGEVKYIALRNITLAYNLPKSFANKIKAENVNMAFNARNLGYLYNSLPNNLNPESFRGTSSAAGYLERSMTPYTATYTFTVAIDF
ncbi:MAG: SusC/RagA family TonB-linked outer membrane protein [Carboxylicivirga sp.]|jgi:iron complex outermembrane receptor protein|nr:SusC/RagA family TonB-linked outer membrane protein [Carboxylicivirga sp.]